MLPIEMSGYQLYDGTGAHCALMLPPLAVENVLTEAFQREKAVRPAANALALGPGGNNLGLVWMMPLGLTVADPIPCAVIGALVQTVDAGQGIVIHADSQEIANYVTWVVRTFSGGGHA